MSKTNLIILTVLITFLACKNTEETISFQNEYFSGEIHSMTTIIPKHNNVNVDSIYQSIVGDETRYFIQDSLYKSMHYRNGELVYYYLYEPSTKRMYDYYSDRPYITFRDSRVNMSPDPESKMEIYSDSIINVLDVSAFKTEVMLYGTHSDVYYSSDLAIDPSPFNEHEAGDWSSTLKLTNGALPVYSINYHDDYTQIKETVSINRTKQNIEFFEVPNDVDIYPSFTVLEEFPQFNQPNQSTINCYQTKAAKIPDLVAGDEERVFYFRFIVTENGDVEYPDSISPEFEIVGEIGEEILDECGFSFQPGILDGEITASEILFSLPFQL